LAKFQLLLQRRLAGEPQPHQCVGDIKCQSTDGTGKEGKGFFGFAVPSRDRLVSCPGLCIAGKLPCLTAG